MSENNHKWSYTRVGGVTRVAIASGEDIARLGELDQKQWTVLSCPIKNLEFDKKTLAFIDADSDGVIRAEEVIKAAQWLSAAVADKDSILMGKDSISLDEFASTPEGESLKAGAQTILANMGKEGAKTICIADVSDYSACKAEQEIDRASVFPYGDNTEAAIAAYEAVSDKVADFFTRCKLLRYDAEAAAATAVSVTDISLIGNCPISKPNVEALLPLDAINPAWQGAFNSVKTLILDVDYPESKEGISEQQWNAIPAKFGAFKAWKSANAVFVADKEVVEMDKFLHLYRDFYQFLRNYVNFSDFYSLDKSVRATFEAGELFIDERCCRLCVKVDDMSKHADMAGLSGMYLIYCNCTSRINGTNMNIVAAMTEGETKNLRPGKNAVFYDRSGQDWDAVVTKIVDNPISIKQAFWAPYRKFWNFCVGLLNKSAAEKDSKIVADMQNTVADAQKGGVKPQAFDIAKFAGIFAAIGMAIGFIGQALAAIVAGLAALKLWQILVVVIIIMLFISGPSCFIAWGKLRKRDLGPVLNAGGWAINSVVLVNIVFGATLTSIAKYPKLNVRDPYKKVVPLKTRIIRWSIFAVIVAFGVLYFSGNLEAVGLPYHKGDLIEAIGKIGSDFQNSLQGAMDAGAAAADSVKTATPPEQ